MKTLRVILITIALMCFMPSAFAVPTVILDGEMIVFDDCDPQIINDRVFVPMRRIFEQMGACVDWVAETKTVFASKRFTTVSLTIGASEYYIDGTAYSLDVPVVVAEGRTLVPVRVVAEALGAGVEWDGENSRVIIESKNGDFIILDRYIDYWECADDGAVIMTGRIAYPEIQSDDKIAVAFNEFYLGDAEEALQEKKLKYTDDALLSYNLLGENYIPYMAERSFDITYNSGNIISILSADSDFAGGFHPSYDMFGMTYDMITGERVECTDILKENISTIRNNVKDKLLKAIEEEPDSFYSDAVDCLDEVLAELKWYLAEDGVHFFLNPYEIAPYARGVVEIIY